MADGITLRDENRKKLDGIVNQMIANKESDSDIRFVVEDFKSKYGEKKNPVQNESPSTSTQFGSGLNPFQSSQVYTSNPTPLYTEQQKSDQIGERFKFTPLNVPTEFGRVASAMKSAKKVKDTLPQVPSLSDGESLTVIPEGDKIGESLTKASDFNDVVTDKLTNQKTGLQKQLDSATGAFRDVQGNDIANDVQNYQREEDTLKIKEELGFTEGVSRTGRNFVNRLEQFIPNTALAIGGTLEAILGEDVGGQFYSNITKGGDLEFQRGEAFRKLDELKPAMEYTKGLIESGKDFDIPGLAAAVVDATSSLLSTAITSAPTAGIGLYSDMVGGGIYDYNTTKANRLGISVDELYKQGKNEFIIPAMLQGLSARLEGIGLKGIKDGILSNVKKGAGQKFALIAHSANKEGFTEFLQTGVDGAQGALSEGKNPLQAAEIAVSDMFSKKGMESYLMGVVASGSAIAGGRMIKGLMTPKSKKQVSESTDRINQMQQELTNPELTDESKVFIVEAIQDDIAKVVDAVSEDVDATEKLGAEQKQEIVNLGEQIEKVNAVVNDGAVTDETRALAEQKADELSKELDDKLKEKPKKTELDKEIAEANKVDEVVDTEEQIIAEGQEAETEYKKTDDQVTYEQKIKDLEDRAEKLPKEEIIETDDKVDDLVEKSLPELISEIPDIKVSEAATGTLYIENKKTGEKIRISDHEPNFGAPRSTDYTEVYTHNLEGKEINKPHQILDKVSELFDVKLPQPIIDFIDNGYKQDALDLERSEKSKRENEEVVRMYQEKKQGHIPFVEKNKVELDRISKEADKFSEDASNGDKRRKKRKSYFTKKVKDEFGYDLDYSDYKDIESQLLDTNKQQQDATKITSTESMDVGKQTTDGERMGEGNAQQEVTKETISKEVPTSKEEVNEQEEKTSKDKRPDTVTGSDKAVAEEVDQLSEFKDIVDKSKTLDEAFKKAQSIKGITKEVSQQFNDTYNPKGELTPKQTFEKFYNETKSDKKEVVEPVSKPKEPVKEKYVDKGREFFSKAQRLFNQEVISWDELMKLSPEEKIKAQKRFEKWAEENRDRVLSTEIDQKSEPTKIQSALEKLKEAKAKLDAKGKKLSIASDPKEDAKDLYDYHKALVDVAKAYIETGVDNVKDFAKEIGEKVGKVVQDAWDEANGGEKKTVEDFDVKSEPKPPKEESKPLEEVSGIKKALVSDEIIESVNLDKISDKEMLELGKKLVETGEIKPANIVLSIAKGTPRALQPKEVVALIYYKATLDNQRRELLSEYNNKVENGESVADVALELDEVQTNTDLYDVMAVITANQQSLAFRLRKGLLDKDYNLVTQIEQYKKVNSGVIPPDVEARFRELDKQLTELKDKLKEAEQRAIEAEEVKSVSNIIEDIERTKSTAKRSSLTPQEKARKKELAKKYNVFNDITRIATIVAEKDFREYAKLIFKEAKGDFVEFGRELIKNLGSDIKEFLPKLYKDLGGKGEVNISDLIQKPFVKDGELVIPNAFIRDAVEQGNTDINTLTEAVKKVVESELPGVTIRAVRDAITKYGRTVNQTKDIVQQQINEAKRLGRLYSELEDLLNKKAKERSGKVFNKMSDQERELKRKIRLLEKEIPPTPEIEERTEAQRSNLRKEYLKRFIQEKKDRLDKGNFAPKPKRSPIRKDSEIIDLETEANKIRDEYDAAHYDNQQANRSIFKKTTDTIKEWGTGLSRALVAGLDFGFFLVQGIISVGSSNPAKTYRAVSKSLTAGLGTNANPITQTRRFFRELGSEEGEREQLANLKAQPYYQILKSSGVAIQEPNAKLGERDDALQASVINKVWNFAMLPVKYINPKAYEVAVKANPWRAGERAYTGAANAIRVQMFLDFASALKEKGISYEDSPELYNIAANTANNMTFRGRLRFAEPIAAELNMLYFSARKVTAALSLVNPAYWVDLAVRNPIVAKQALLKMATFIGVATTITLALQAFSDDDEEEQNPDMFNPYSSDFMTYRIGNTRLNFFGGLGGNLVLFARMLTSNYKTTSSSKTKALGQDSFTPNRKELLETTLFANKLNPVAGVGYAFLNQSVGREIDWESEAVSSVSPLWAQNISELQKEHPYVMATFLSYMSFMGQSINTYGTPDFIDRKKDKDIFDLIQNKNASFSKKTRSNVDVIDINTGELREITKDEFKVFQKEYGDYIKKYLKDNVKEMSNMPVSKVEKEVTNLKSRATKYAKEVISGITPEMLVIRKNEITYKLTPDQIKYRKILNQEYDDKNRRRITREIMNDRDNKKLQSQELDEMIEKKIKSEANSNSREIILEENETEKGKYNLNIKD